MTAAGLANNDGGAGEAARHKKCGERLHRGPAYTQTLNRPTSPLSVSAVAASVCAEAAISWVEALVCCVDADTCSAEADDCSATVATSAMSASARDASAEIWWTAVAISPTRPVTSWTAAPIASKAA